MKLVFLGTSSAIIYYMRYHKIIKLSYDKEQDTFRYLLLIGPSALLALLTTHNYTLLEVRRGAGGASQRSAPAGSGGRGTACASGAAAARAAASSSSRQRGAQRQLAAQLRNRAASVHSGACSISSSVTAARHRALCGAVACRHRAGVRVPQVLWTFSILLEAVAILPQLVLLQRTNNIDNLTGNYVFLLG